MLFFFFYIYFLHYLSVILIHTSSLPFFLCFLCFFARFFLPSFSHLIICSSLHPFIHSSMHSFTYSFIYSFTHSVFHPSIPIMHFSNLFTASIAPHTRCLKLWWTDDQNDCTMVASNARVPVWCVSPLAYCSGRAVCMYRYLSRAIFIELKVTRF